MTQKENKLFESLLDKANGIQEKMQNVINAQDAQIKNQASAIETLTSNLRLMYSFMICAITADGYKFINEEQRELFNELCERCNLPTIEEFAEQMNKR